MFGIVLRTAVIAQATIHTLFSVHFWIKKAKRIGSHAYRVAGAYASASGTSATICRILNIYHFICFIFLNVTVNAIVRMRTTSGAV